MLCVAGVRVVLTLPNDPMLQVIQEEPPLTRSVRIKGKKLRFVYMRAEE